MAAISQKIFSLIGGVSQQPDTIKSGSQLRVCDNYYPDTATGLTKRPGLRGISKLANAVADEEALVELKAIKLKERADAKLNRQTILRSAMGNYARYGTNSSFMNILSEQELNNITSTELVVLIHNLTN